MTGERRPIGYWLKRLDGLIERTFERNLADEGVPRRDYASQWGERVRIRGGRGRLGQVTPPA